MNLKQLNILLADDDTDDCYFLKEALNEFPLPTHLTAVHDGEQLMQLLTKETNELPHVLFLVERKNYQKLFGLTTFTIPFAENFN